MDTAYVRENPSPKLHFRYLKLLVIIYLEPQGPLFFEGQPLPEGGLNSKHQPLKINKVGTQEGGLVSDDLTGFQVMLRFLMFPGFFFPVASCNEKKNLG